MNLGQKAHREAWSRLGNKRISWLILNAQCEIAIKILVRTAGIEPAREVTPEGF